MLLRRNDFLFFLSFISMSLLLDSCEKKHLCKYKVTKKIMATRLIDGQDTSFAHYILCDSLYRDCLDSGQVVGMIKSYVDGFNVDTPVEGIYIMNSIEGMIESQGDSQPPEFYRNILLAMQLKDGNIQRFYFYNSDGKRVSRENWK